MAPLGHSSNGPSYTQMPTADVRTWRIMDNQEEARTAAIEEGENDDVQSLLTDNEYTSASGVYNNSRFESSAKSASMVSSLCATTAISSDEEDDNMSGIGPGNSIHSRAGSRLANEKWRKTRKSVIGGVILASTLGVAAWLGVHFAKMQETSDAEASVPEVSVFYSQGIIHNPQLRVLLETEIQPLMQDKDSAMIASGVNATLNRLENVVVKNLPKEQREMIEKQQISARTWADFAALAKAMRDPRVKELGRNAFDVIRNSSVFEGPKALSLKIMDHLMPRAAELNSLRKELIPRSFTEALDRWAQERHLVGSELTDESHSEAWRGMLDPRITKLMRGNGTIEIDMTAGRRLNAGTWAHPVLNGFETTVGITTVVLVVVMEIMLHIEVLNPKFSLPTWAWMMILVPANTVAVWTCVTGLSLWCDLVFGALGLNVLDAIYLILRMR